MSAPAFAWALERGKALDLLPADRLVLIYLADKANGVKECWPGQPLIESFTGLAPKTVRTSIHRLSDLQLIRVIMTPGKVTKYLILRPDTPVNGAPTPANSARPPRQNVPHHPSTIRPAPRQNVPDTPVNGAPEPSINQERTLRRAPTRAEEGFDSFPTKQASEAEDRPPSPAEVVAGRIEAHGDVAAMPAAARCAISTIKHAMLAPVPRPPKLSWSEQVAALADRRTRPVPQEPIRTVDEQLAELQRMIAAEVAVKRQRPSVELE